MLFACWTFACCGEAHGDSGGAGLMLSKVSRLKNLLKCRNRPVVTICCHAWCQFTRNNCACAPMLFQGYPTVVLSQMKLTMDEPASMTTDNGSRRVTSYCNSVFVHVSRRAGRFFFLYELFVPGARREFPTNFWIYWRNKPQPHS